MNKSTHFSGQPTFAQLIRLLPLDLISRCVEKHNSDHYYKRFNTLHHLVTMLFTCYGRCQSLRETTTGMRALEGKLLSCGIKYLPTRSTFSDANAKRNSEVFASIYLSVKDHWDRIYPDSRKHRQGKTYILDSTTIKLFQEIFKGAGMSKDSGKRKGGLKVHMALLDNDKTPSIIHLTQAAYNDVSFTKYLKVPRGSTLVMDRGYRSYSQFNLWTQQEVRWVTRLNPYTSYRIIKKIWMSPRQKKAGVQSDSEIVMGAAPKKIQKVKCRLIKFYAKDNKKTFYFITNDFKSSPTYIAELYRRRWRIELLFKRLKQNMPLQYFLGDNQNAIKIQVWCALIADLLLQIIRRQVKRKWSFSNIVSIVRLHLFNYLNLYSFLEEPDKAHISIHNQKTQLKLSLSG